MNGFVRIEPTEAHVVIRAPLYLFKSVRFPIKGVEIDIENSAVAMERALAGLQQEVTIFEDGALHEAWNRSNSPRVTLICDPPASSNKDAARAALEGYERRYGLGYLLRTYGKSKPASHPYNRLALPALLRLESRAVRLEPWLFSPILFYYNHRIARCTPAAHAMAVAASRAEPKFGSMPAMRRG